MIITSARQIKSQIDEELLDVGILLHQLLLHQDLFIVLHLTVLRDGGVAVELQLVVTVLRLAWLVVGVLVGVVVGQGHLAELLLRGVGHGARLEVWFGRVLQGGDQLEPHVRENKVGNVNDSRKRTAKTSLAALHSSPPGSPCCPLNRRDGKDGGHTQTQLHRLVAGQVLRGDSHGSPKEVQAHFALSQLVLGDGTLSLACPLKAIVTVGLAGTVVPIFIVFRQLHFSKLLVDNRLNIGRVGLQGGHGGNRVLRRHDGKRTFKVNTKDSLKKCYQAIKL